MQKYLLEVCFDPSSDARHAIEFGDFCVRALGDSGIYHGASNAIEFSLTGCIERERLAKFWVEQRDALKRQLDGMVRTIRTYNQTLSYSQLPEVFAVLDSWVSPTSA
jgi:hypothetical protein